MRTIMKNEDGFTGLEAAIVLIAFVVVAAVFSYVVLGAGFFTTQKSQEVVHTGVSQTSSSVEVVGNVYGLVASGGTEISLIRFDIGLTAGGSPVDMAKTIMAYSATDSTGVTYLDFDAGFNPAADDIEDVAANSWAVIEKSAGSGDTDNLLERGEIFTIGANVPATGTIGANQWMRLEVRPPVGAVLGLDRTAPAQIDKVNTLY